MPIDKIAFKGVETSIQSQQEVKKEETQKQLEPVDKEKSNAAKYMIGATALAAVIGLGIAGRKGYLGEGVQKLLGGAKKSSDDIAEAGEKKGGEIIDDISSKAKDTPSDVKPKSGEEIGGEVHPKTKDTPDAPAKFTNPDGTLKNGSETVDIIKDGHKTGVEIKEYKDGDLLSTTVKSLDDKGNLKIEEKFADGRTTLLEEGEFTPSVGSDREPKRAWFYKEKSADGKEKSMRLVFEKDGAYTTSAMGMSPEEKNIIRAKLEDMGVILRKTDEPIHVLKGLELINANFAAMEGKSGKEMNKLLLSTKKEIMCLENPEQKTELLAKLLENIKKYAKPDDCDFVFNLEFEKGRNTAFAKELIGFAQENPEFEQKIIRGLLDSNCGCNVEEMTVIRQMLFARGLKPKGTVEGRGLVETDWGCTDTHFPSGRWLGFYRDKNLPKYKAVNFIYDMSMGVEPKRAETLIREITENAEAYERGLCTKADRLIEIIKSATLKETK